jgi:hypothetical protein
MATDSRSRISTAIWARFAASATRLKSRRKGEAVSGRGSCGGGCEKERGWVAEEEVVVAEEGFGGWLEAEEEEEEDVEEESIGRDGLVVEERRGLR